MQAIIQFRSTHTHAHTQTHTNRANFPRLYFRVHASSKSCSVAVTVNTIKLYVHKCMSHPLLCFDQKKAASSEFYPCLTVEAKFKIWLHPECTCVHNHTSRKAQAAVTHSGMMNSWPHLHVLGFSSNHRLLVPTSHPFLNTQKRS